MNDFPLISIIIPAYNAEKWLSECIHSIVNQTYPNVEVIIVDDGSTDATLQIANELARTQENIKVIHTENRGVCAARNMGLDTAQGEYITFLDADDCLITNALTVLYESLISHSADISIGWKTNMKSDGTEIGCPYSRMQAVWTEKQGLEQSFLDHPATYAVWGKLYKADLLKNIRFIEGKRVHEDSFFVFQCLMKQPKVVLCDDIVLRYRISENSASRAAFSDKFLDILYFAEEKHKCIVQFHPELLGLADNIVVKANLALLNNLVKNKDPKYRSVEKECIQAVKRGKRSFHSAIPADQKWFYIITHNLYDIYKWLRNWTK